MASENRIRPTRVNSRPFPQSHVGEKMWKKSPRYQTCTHTQKQQKKLFPSAGTAEANLFAFFAEHVWGSGRSREGSRRAHASRISYQCSSPRLRTKIFSYRLLEASRWLSFCGRQSLHKVPQFNEKIIFSTLSSHKSLICGSGKTRLMLTQSEHEV